MLKVGLITGVAILVLTLGVNWLVGMMLPGIMQEYQNVAIFRPWEDPLMMVYFVYPFIFGVVAAYLWNIIKNSLKGDEVKKALQFAKIYFIIATIPGMFITYTSMQISLTMVVLWAIVGYVQAFVAGYIFAKMKWG